MHAPMHVYTAKELETLLIGYLSRIGAPRDSIRSASLAELLQALIARAGFTR